jgi:hypothetical protein
MERPACDRTQSDREGSPIPKSSKVDKVYEALKGKGMDKGKAARIAQSKTGKSLETGRAPKGKGK